MDANTANIKAAQERLNSLNVERDSIQRRIERDKANLAALDVQIAALAPLATAPEPEAPSA